MVRIEIREDACRGCRICVDVCPTKVLAFDDASSKSKVAAPQDCIACLSCAYACPSGCFRHSEYHAVKNFYRDLQFTARRERFV